jgi:hypothetical protein
VLGLLTGILVSEGILDPDRQVTTVIPEMSETAPFLCFAHARCRPDQV